MAPLTISFQVVPLKPSAVNVIIDMVGFKSTIFLFLFVPSGFVLPFLFFLYFFWGGESVSIFHDSILFTLLAY